MFIYIIGIYGSKLPSLRILASLSIEMMVENGLASLSIEMMVENGLASLSVEMMVENT